MIYPLNRPQISSLARQRANWNLKKNIHVHFLWWPLLLDRTVKRKLDHAIKRMLMRSIS